MTTKEKLRRITSGLVWELRLRDVPYNQAPDLSNEEAQLRVGLSLLRNRNRLIAEAAASR